jgi:hypothetical protein
MEITEKMKLKNNIVITQSGVKYFLYTLLDAIEEFNKRCPIIGCIIDRNNIEHMGEHTHITKKIEFKEDKLIVDIEPLVDGLENAKIRPIIKTPLRLGSGVQTTRILGIFNIFLEV